MTNLIAARVHAAREGTNPYVITKMKSGWLVIGDVQPLPGYCLLLADPVVPSINDLRGDDRTTYLSDMARVGDALLEATSAYRINYETWGNSDPALHTHIVPRYPDEPDEKRRLPACMVYSWKDAKKFDPVQDSGFVSRMAELLK